MASHKEEVAARSAAFFAAMRTGTFLLCNSHGDYKAESFSLETVPDNTYVFEAQTIGDFCYAGMTPTAWNLLQPMMRPTLIDLLAGNFSMKDRSLMPYVHFLKQFTVYGPGDTYYNRTLSLNNPLGIPLGVYSFGRPGVPSAYCVPPRDKDPNVRKLYKANDRIREFCKKNKCVRKPDCSDPVIYDVIAPPLESDTAEIIDQADAVYLPTPSNPLVIFFISCGATDFTLSQEEVTAIMDLQHQQHLKYLEVTPTLLGGGVNYPAERHQNLPGFRTPDPNFFRAYGGIYVEDEKEEAEPGYLPGQGGGARRKTLRRLKLRKRKRVTRRR